MEFSYPGEAPSSVVSRWVARGRLDPALAQDALAGEISLPLSVVQAMRRAGAPEPALHALCARSISEWPRATAEDLHRPSSDFGGVGKGCEACLAEDVLAGRDHYIRREWCLAWSVSCQRHRRALVDLEAAELVPVVIDGVRDYRVRFFRDVDHLRDPFRCSQNRGGGRSGSFSVLGSCLEADIGSALGGAKLPDRWCLGRDWPQARIVLTDLTDLLLTQARGSRERLIHRFADGDWIPQEQASQFASGCFTSIGAFWQRRLLESCARLLIDPTRFAHLEDGQRLNVHAELAYGRIGQERARSALGQLANSDLLCLLLAYAGEKHLAELAPRIRAWPAPLTKRVASAAAVALYIL